MHRPAPPALEGRVRYAPDKQKQTETNLYYLSAPVLLADTLPSLIETCGSLNTYDLRIVVDVQISFPHAARNP
jgi:hypothetical protein